jgi:hypothetical protein
LLPFKKFELNWKRLHNIEKLLSFLKKKEKVR